MHLVLLLVFFVMLTTILRNLGDMMAGNWVEFAMWTGVYFLSWKLLRTAWPRLITFTLIKAWGVYVLFVGLWAGAVLYLNGHTLSGEFVFVIALSVGVTCLAHPFVTQGKS